MSASQHRIGRLAFDIAAPDPAALDGFNAMLRSHFDTVIAPALATVLDKADLPGRLLRYERIEIDLGRIDPDILDADDLAHRVADGLAAALDVTGFPMRRTEDAMDDVEELARFLRTGMLPWAEPGQALAALTHALLARNAGEFARLVEYLRPDLVRRDACLRLVQQFPVALLQRMLPALLPPEQAASAETALAAYGLAAAGTGHALIPAARASAAAAMLHRLAVGRTTHDDLGEVLAFYAECVSGASAAVSVSAGPASGVPGVAARQHDSEITDEQEPAAGNAVLPVFAAGGVLLHPFLETFFERLGLLDAAGLFRNADCRARAVLLSHYLAAGADDIPEPETPLFKLLCGMPLAEPLPRMLAPSAQERDEARDLLASVIAHWGRLGNTTPEGLREGFLLRPGNLQRRGEFWYLTVEPRGVDVLLEHLPWALSQVRTRYMHHLLMVDWR